MAIVGVETLWDRESRKVGAVLHRLRSRADRTPRKSCGVCLTGRVARRDRTVGPQIVAFRIAGGWHRSARSHLGVDTPASREALARSANQFPLTRDADGTVHFVPDFGVVMGLRTFAKKAVVSPPDRLNAPGYVRRLSQHRKWRQRARPKVIGHVVFALSDYEAGARFMLEMLNFRLSDVQRGFGMYLRADGSNNHHNFLLLKFGPTRPRHGWHASLSSRQLRRGRHRRNHGGR